MSKSKPTPGRREIRRFQRAADARLGEALFLLANQYTTAAVYLAGYAVECALKALILSSEPASRHEETLLTFRGAKAHDFNWLRRQLGRRRMPLPLPVEVRLRTADWWTTDLRYTPRNIEETEARIFLTTADELVRWVKGRI